MPHGISGLLIAAILAAAMSNLSAALNSLSSSTMLDFFVRSREQTDERKQMRLSRLATVGWALVLFWTCGSVLAQSQARNRSGIADRIRGLRCIARECFYWECSHASRESARGNRRNGVRLRCGIVFVAVDAGSLDMVCNDWHSNYVCCRIRRKPLLWRPDAFPEDRNPLTIYWRTRHAGTNASSASRSVA